ncbi:MAG: hypothetical protein MI863_26990, partial [Desulfobacterales bacterium]|nr:hypothetical protein [Desulfobacterales bacterium]
KNVLFMNGCGNHDPSNMNHRMLKSSITSGVQTASGNDNVWGFVWEFIGDVDNLIVNIVF